MLYFNGWIITVANMDFARKQLEKYGWADGKGLGKNEDGISQALKPKLKRSVAGIGHDAASDFTEHWWSELYDKAAKNVEVEEKNGKTKRIKTKDAEEFEITNSTWKLKRKQNKKNEEEQYSDYFVKKALLDGGGIKGQSVADSDSECEDSKDVFKLTDEELFAACKGRTAHKGARHGLKAAGKLARIAQQEQMLLSQPQYNGYSHSKKIAFETKCVDDLKVVEDVTLNSDGDTFAKKKKKKKKKCVSLNGIEKNNQDLAEHVMHLPENIKNVSVETDASNICDESGNKKNKKSKKKHKNDDANEHKSDCLLKVYEKNKLLDLDYDMNVDDMGNSEDTLVKIKKSKKNKLKYL